MNLNDDHNYIPGLKLLPFGGFEVSVLLNQLKSGQRNGDTNDDSTEFQPPSSIVSSGWLQSKIMAG